MSENRVRRLRLIVALTVVLSMLVAAVPAGAAKPQLSADPTFVSGPTLEGSIVSAQRRGVLPLGTRAGRIVVASVELLDSLRAADQSDSGYQDDYIEGGTNRTHRCACSVALVPKNRQSLSE